MLEAMDERFDDVWTSLNPAWPLAYAEAWSSFGDGNLGIGAALVTPGTAEAVALGRNRVSESSQEPRTLSGNFMAHAEMNAFAAMPSFKAEGLDLYTTLQPCLMCAATSIFLHVDRVFYAVTDEYFEDTDDLWANDAYASRWQPEQIGPLGGRLASFARVLPLSVEVDRSPGSPVLALAQNRLPEVTALARELAADGTLRRISDAGGTVVDAIETLWARLPPGSPPSGAAPAGSPE